MVGGVGRIKVFDGCHDGFEGAELAAGDVGLGTDDGVGAEVGSGFAQVAGILGAWVDAWVAVDDDHGAAAAADAACEGVEEASVALAALWPGEAAHDEFFVVGVVGDFHKGHGGRGHVVAVGLGVEGEGDVDGAGAHVGGSLGGEEPQAWVAVQPGAEGGCGEQAGFAFGAGDDEGVAAAQDGLGEVAYVVEEDVADDGAVAACVVDEEAAGEAEAASAFHWDDGALLDGDEWPAEPSLEPEAEVCLGVGGDGSGAVRRVVS